MVLYHAITAYHLLECIIHKNIYHPNDSSTILISSFIQNTYPQYKKLVGNNLFSKVIPIKIGNLISNNSSNPEQEILNYFDNIIPSNFKNIYVCGTYREFACYLCIKNIKFSAFEDAAGCISRYMNQLNYDKSNQPYLYNVVNKYKLYNCDNPLIEHIFVDVDAQLSGYTNHKIIHFKVTNRIQYLTSNVMNSIYDFFEVNVKNFIGKDICLLLTQWFCINGKLINDSTIVLMYQLFVDLFFNMDDNDKLILKLHPADSVNYNKYFREDEIINSKFPIEIISYKNKIKFKKVFSINSTSALQFKSLSKEVKLFPGIFNIRKKLLKYFIAFKLISLLPSYSNYFHCNINDHVLNTLYDSINKTDCKSKPLDIIKNVNHSLFILEDTGNNSINKILNSINNLSSNSIAILIPNGLNLDLYKNHYRDLIAINISKRKTKENVLDNMEDEFVCIFCKDPKIREKIKGFTFTKTLKYTGIEITVKAGERTQYIPMIKKDNIVNKPLFSSSSNKSTITNIDIANTISLKDYLTTYSFHGLYYNFENLKPVLAEGISISGFIKSEPNKMIKIFVNNYANHHIVFKNTQGKIFKGIRVSPNANKVIEFVTPFGSIAYCFAFVTKHLNDTKFLNS